jgi:acetyl esterase/lipase
MPSEAHDALVAALVASGVRTDEAPPPPEAIAAARAADSQNREVPPGLHVQEGDADGVACLRVTREAARGDTTILFFHGGGYIWMTPWTHLPLVGAMLGVTGGTCLSVDYRRAPEHPFPAAVEDAVRAYRWLLASGVDPATLVLAGESAGGGLVAATLLALRDAGEPMPAGGVCISPWTDLAVTGRTADAIDDPIVSGDALRMMASLYLGDAPATTPTASPLYGDLTGLPPLLVQVGTREALLDDARRFADRARDAGVDVTYVEHLDVIHMWVVFGPDIPEAIDAFRRIGAFVERWTRTVEARA